MADELIALFGKITTKDHDQLVEQFSRVLQVQPNVATFFLEASSWNVETAVHNYLASVGNARNSGFSSPPQAQFLGDLSPLENRSFPCGVRLALRLVFKNVGAEAWPSDTRLSFVDGHLMDGPESIPVAAPPGGEASILFEVVSPPSGGTFMGSWRLACNAGYFGEVVYVIVSVNEQQASTVDNEGDAMCDETNTNQGFQASFSNGGMNGGLQNTPQMPFASFGQQNKLQQQQQFGVSQQQFGVSQQQQPQQQEDTDMVDL